MDVSAVKKQIQTNSLQPFYIFTGEEWKAQQIYIEQIAKVSKKQKKYVDSVSDIFSKLGSKALVPQSYVYVLRDDKDIMSDEKLQDKLPSMLGNNILILLITALDKRTKFAKKYAKEIVEFVHFDEKMLTKYIQKEINLNSNRCKKLIEICESDYGRILLEIDKIKQYTIGMDYTLDDKIWNHVFDELLECGAIYVPPYDAIFDFVDAVLKHQINKAFELLYQSYAVGEAIMVLLSVLYNNARQVLQVQQCNRKDIEKATGLTAWQVKCAKEKSGYFESQDLMFLLRLIQSCESGIKQGKIEEFIAVEYILAKFM